MACQQLFSSHSCLLVKRPSGAEEFRGRQQRQGNARRLGAASLCSRPRLSSLHLAPPAVSAASPTSTFALLGRGASSRPIARCHVAAAAAAAGGATFPSEEPQPLPVGDVYPPPDQGSFVNRLRAILFYVVTVAIAIPLFVVMLLIYPFTLLLDPLRRRAQHFVNDLWANSTTQFFYETKIEGLENLPPADSPAVYVSNHQSYLDIFTLFQLRRPFKFISKSSNFLIPIIGWAMYLTGHVPLKRLDKKSQLLCLKACLDLLQKGVPVLFFPEGTRSKDGKLDTFKKGAFSIATKANVPIVPIVLMGTGPLMPSGMESTMADGKVVKVVVHPPISGSDADELCEKTRAVIAETLVKNGYAVR